MADQNRSVCFNVPLFIGGMLIALGIALPATGASPNSEAIWFKPSLKGGSEPICSSFLEGVQRGFLTEMPWSSFPGQGSLQAEGLTEVDLNSLIESEGKQEPPAGEGASADVGQKFLTVDGQKLFLASRNGPGCGGACESQAILVSPDASHLDQASESGADDQIASTEYSREQNWNLFKSSKGNYFLAGQAGNRFLVYRITQPKLWKVSCDVELAPEDAAIRDAAAVRAVMPSVTAFESAVSAITGGRGGDCGTMHTPARWAATVHDILMEALYRPWAVQEPLQGSENTYGDYDRDLENIETWSLGGVYEHRSLAAYKAQLADTAAQLSKFYQTGLGWPKEKADSTAVGRLKEAVSRGVGFYMYSPWSDEERQVRHGILEHKPLSDFSDAISGALAKEKEGQEGLLDLAVTYPEALQLLLKKGANPNSTNPFGKTPLMYAAQYNQFDAARMLLDVGADPNAATSLPFDRCEYQLATSKVTPLHYAARYGNAKIIGLLVQRGAVTYRLSHADFGGIPPGTPLDWLHRYTDPKAAERNPNLAQADVSALESVLRVPGNSELASIARGLTVKAESAYAAGQIEHAYRDISNALQAQPSNPQALSDFSLIALKAGHLGESVSVAQSIIDSNAAVAAKASAWFNIGLACRQAGKPYLEFDGKLFCDYSPIHPFLTAWKLQPTAARAQKLTEVLGSISYSGCTVGTGPSAQHYFFSGFVDGDEHTGMKIYTLHPASVGPDAKSISWDVQFAGHAQPDSISPNLIETDVLGDKAITVLGNQYGAQSPVRIGAETCVLSNSDK